MVIIIHNLLARYSSVQNNFNKKELGSHDNGTAHMGSMGIGRKPKT
jgi:hypothetical protein